MAAKERTERKDCFASPVYRGGRTGKIVKIAASGILDFHGGLITIEQYRLAAVTGVARREMDAATICIRSGETIQTLRRCAMTVRNVVECTLVIVVLLVLALIGWQTCVVTGDITNLKHDMLTRQDMAEAVRAVAASKESGGDRPLISLASNVIPAPPDASEKTGVLPQSSAGTAARGVDADVPAQLKDSATTC